MVQSSLKPSAQCIKAVKKAKQTLGQMSRALHFRDKVTWVRLYVQYCRSHLEYCVQSWSPWLRTDIDLLESVQERAIRMVLGLKATNYLERLKEVGLTTLEARRDRGDMIQVWKILHQHDDVDPQTWFRMASEGDRLTRHSANPWNISRAAASNNEVKEKDLDIRTHFFSIRSVDKWNSLPDFVQSSQTLNSFKNNFDSHIAQLAILNQN